MNFSNLLDNYEPYKRVEKSLISGITPIGISGVSESAQGQLIFQLSEREENSAIVICYSDLEALSLYRDISYFNRNAVFFPSKEYVFYDIEAKDRENEQTRLAALYKSQKGKTIIVTSIDAVMKYTIAFDDFLKTKLCFKIGERFNLERLSEQLVAMGYSNDSTVEGKGQFSMRGGILDIFSPNMDTPARIEFFDDEVDSIRIFDGETQRSIENIEEAEVVPCKECFLDFEKKERLKEEIKSEIKRLKRKKEEQSDRIFTLESDLEKVEENISFPAIDKYVGKIYDNIPTVLDFCRGFTAYIIDSKRISERAKNIEWELGETVSSMLENGIISDKKGKYILNYNEVLSKISPLKTVVFNAFANTKSDFSYNFICDFATKTSVSFHGKIDYLIDDLRGWCEREFTVLIFARSESNAKNLNGVLMKRGFECSISEDGEFIEGKINIITGILSKGFEYPEAKIAIVSDREIFDVGQKQRKRRLENTQRIKSYNDLHPGDYVVHQAHGIGIYEGIKKITAFSVTKDYFQVKYRGADVLYVPVEQMDVLYKYSGNTEKALTLNKLGGTDWSKTKQRVRKSTEEMAKKLVELYAKRESTSGYAFSPDTVWQREFEDTFIYSETEDQLRSIEEVKEDMEKSRPMDRLLCGDVGFGKTEVALRAAFKAVCDGKQVAYLCPTTILAMQHYNTFLNRMEKFPINVGMLSRFKTPSQQKKLLSDLKNGEVDIVIGTHKLLQESVEFSDLGLLIVDEEQRFGVGHKEKLKELKKNVDVLTMTATPIPRTLHMSMISIRDMSVLTEPPENRYPVRTYVLEENKGVLIDAIKNELARGGQVFYLHNRVQGIFGVAEWIKKEIPEARVSVGHGKMKESELEDIMYSMVNGDIDILVCTTIIETGLDIPNANTIIIEDADRMGLSQLYQLRGRVGRSNRMAYAYLTYKKDKMLSDTAEKRLRAIKEFTEFGSGFKIAMRDLEIRGAGNVLGPEQSGHMEAVGYDMYCKILKESVDSMQGKISKEDFSTSVDIPIDAFIPEKYIKDAANRIEIYKKIAGISCDEDRFDVEDEMIDRFGDIPRQAQNVIEVASLKAKANSLGIYELIQRADNLAIKFERDKIDLQKVLELDKKYPSQVKFIPTEKPVINFRLKDKNKLLDEIKQVLSEL